MNSGIKSRTKKKLIHKTETRWIFLGKNIKSLEEKSHSSLISSEVSELSLRRKVRKERVLPRARGAEAIDSGKEVPLTELKARACVSSTPLTPQCAYLAKHVPSGSGLGSKSISALTQLRLQRGAGSRPDDRGECAQERRLGCGSLKNRNYSDHF